MSKLDVSLWLKRQPGFLFPALVTLALVAVPSTAQTSDAGSSSTAVDAAVTVARWRGAFLSNDQGSLFDSLQNALLDLVRFESVVRDVWPLACLIIGSAAALMVFGMRSESACEADR
jgi:hypothetical protein